MRRIVFLLLIISPLLLKAQLVYQPTNLDFENGFLNEPPYGWYLSSETIDAGNKALVTDEDPFHGKKSLHIYNYNKPNTGNVANPDAIPVCTVIQGMDAFPFRGKTIRIIAAVKTHFVSDQSSAELWIQCRAERDKVEASARMKENPINNTFWQYYSVTLKIPEDANELTYGIIARGEGEVYFDDVKVEVDEPLQTVLAPPEKLAQQEKENYIAFAKLFGTVKYFHPASESRNLDWERFLLAGISKVGIAKNNDELKTKLLEIFKPIAPTLDIYAGENNSYSYAQPEGSAEKVADAWLHTGGYNYRPKENFKSEIKNVYSTARFREAAVIQILNVEDIHGKDAVIKANIKLTTHKPGSFAQIWIRFDDNFNKIILGKGSKEFPKADDKWHEVEVKTTVPDNAKIIRIGMIFQGEGTAWFDDVSMKCGTGKQLKKFEVRNPGFEDDAPGELTHSWIAPKSVINAGYQVVVVNDEHYEGKNSLKIQSDRASEILMPEPGEIYTEKLTGNLAYSLPIALYADTADHTLPKSGLEPNFNINNKPDGFNPVWNDRLSRIAIIIDAWCIIRNFNATDIPEKDLDSALGASLYNVAEINNKADFDKALLSLLKVTKDPQARIWNITQNYEYGLPLIFNTANNKIYIEVSGDSSLGIPQGSIVRKMNGKDPMDIFRENSDLTAAYSNSWKKVKSLAMMRIPDDSKKIEFELTTPSGKEFSKTVENNYFLSDYTETRPEPFKDLGNGIYYVDLSVVDDKKFKSVSDILASAKGVIYDLRGSARIAEHFMSYYFTHPVQSLSWQIPVYAMPNEEMVSYQTLEGQIANRRKMNGVKSVMLINGKTYGYSEAIAYIFKNYQIGKLIGEPTAGSASETLTTRIAGQYNISLSEVFAIDSDNKKLFGAGIQPDILVEQTSENFKNGTDAALQKALEILSK